MKLKPLTAVEGLYVTASMSPVSRVGNAADLAKAHRNRGFSRIAVHYVIERDGALVEGRPLNLPGVLAGKRFDACTYQVCLLGGVNDALNPEADFTPEQLTALDALRLRFELPVIYAPDFPR